MNGHRNSSNRLQVLLFILLIGLFVSWAVQMSNPSPSKIKSGDMIDHEANFSFVVPSGFKNIEIYSLGEYSRDESIVVRMQNGREGPSIAVRIFEKSAGRDFFQIVSSHQLKYDSPKRVSSRNLEQAFSKQPLGVNNNNDAAYGWRTSTYRNIEGSVVYVDREDDVLVISYAAAEQYYRPNLKNFDSLLNSIIIN